MSGGSMDYVCFKIENAAGYVSDKEVKDLLMDIAELLHDLEWYDSGDYSKDTYLKTLVKFKTKWFKGNRSKRLKGYIDESLGQVRSELYQMIGEQNDQD